MQYCIYKDEKANVKTTIIPFYWLLKVKNLVNKTLKQHLDMLLLYMYHHQRKSGKPQKGWNANKTVFNLNGVSITKPFYFTYKFVKMSCNTSAVFEDWPGQVAFLTESKCLQ